MKRVFNSGLAVFGISFFSVLWFISVSTTADQSKPNRVTPPPAGKLYHGVFPGGTTGDEDDISFKDLQAYETEVGKTAVWVYFSHNWFKNRAFPIETASWIRSAGSVPFIRIMMRSDTVQNRSDPPFALSKIIEGEFDADLRKWGRAAKEFEYPILAEFGTEMNGKWFPWNGFWNDGERLDKYGKKNGPDGPERFKNAYRRIIRLTREEGASNISWVFHANNEDHPNEKWNFFEEYYPGDEWFDWLGVSVYGAQSPNDRHWEKFPDLMDKVYPRLSALAPAKPIVILEFGVTSGNPLGNQADWANEALSQITRNRWPRVIGFSWWNEKWENDDTHANDTNMRVQDTPELKEAFKKWVGNNKNILGRAIFGGGPD